MADIWAAVLVSFGVVFVAELGDKSQLMAMTFAARYRAWQVIAGRRRDCRRAPGLRRGSAHCSATRCRRVGSTWPRRWPSSASRPGPRVVTRLTDEEKRRSERSSGAAVLAFVVGCWLGTRLPEKVLASGAAALFVLFGGWLSPRPTAGVPISLD